LSAEDDLLTGIDPPPMPQPPPAGKGDRDFWENAVRTALAARSPRSLVLAEEAINACPGDPELLLLAALTALANAQPERAHAVLKRFRKRYVPAKDANLLTALALGQQQQWAKALSVLRDDKLDTDRAAVAAFIGDAVMQDWLLDNLHEIKRKAALADILRRPAKPPPPRPAARAATKPPRPAPVAPALPAVADLPKLEAHFDMAFDLANVDAIATT